MNIPNRFRLNGKTIFEGKMGLVYFEIRENRYGMDLYAWDHVNKRFNNVSPEGTEEYPGGPKIRWKTRDDALTQARFIAGSAWEEILVMDKSQEPIADD